MQPHDGEYDPNDPAGAPEGRAPNPWAAPPQPAADRDQSSGRPPQYSQPEYGPSSPYGPAAAPQHGQQQYGQHQYGQQRYGQQQYGQQPGAPSYQQPPPDQYGQPSAYGPSQNPYGPSQNPYAQSQGPYTPTPQQPSYPPSSPYGSSPAGYPTPSQYPAQPPYSGPQYGQPGAPQYGTYQPVGPPPRKANKKPLGIVGALVAVVIIVGGAVYAITNLGSHQLSHTAVEKTIENQSTDTSKSFRAITNVNCNDGKNIAVKKGATFTCTADDSVKITVVIQSTSRNPDWVWAVN